MSAIKVRLFLTCWMVYVLHFATDFVREHYLVVSIVEDHAYRLDQYYGLHVDIFRNPPEAKVQGAHHGANPGISMLAAIPYALTRPAVDWVVKRELAARKLAGSDSAAYRDPRPRRVAFYQTARARGLDIRFGLVGAINIPIIHYSVIWWNSLHQAPSLSMGSSAMSWDFLIPLLAATLGFSLLFGGVVLARMRAILADVQTEARLRRRALEA